jgi:2,5-diketo-D-gluconate reductase A
MSNEIAPAPAKSLLNGVQMPALGLGTWPMDDAEAAKAVASALRSGYRLVDTAENYGNETGVGEGIRSAGVPRDDVFVTTKFNSKWHSVAGVREAAEASLDRLGLDYLDLLLIHWPNPAQDRYVEAFEGLQRVLEAGLVRAIGVSNFKPAHLERLFAAGFVPHVNQIQLDPQRPRADIVALNAAKGTVTESWSPIGRGDALLREPAIVAIADAHERTPAQVVLRWHVQHGFIPTPKSGNAERQRENLDVFGFELTTDQITALDALATPDAEIVDADSFGH